MSSTSRPSPSTRFLLFLLGSPFYLLYGLVAIGQAVGRGVRRVRGVRAALDSSVVCQNGHQNTTVGRWSCAACGSVYHGWVGRCAVCGAPAGKIECVRCGVGIRLPWSER